MSIENLQSRIEALHARANDPGIDAPVRAELLSALEEMSGLAEQLTDANAQVGRRLAIQYEVIHALAESTGASQASARVLQAICEVSGAGVGMLWIFDRDLEQLAVENVWQTEKKPARNLARLSRALCLSPGEGLPGEVYLSNKPLWIPEIGEHVGFPRQEAALKDRLRSALLFPIRSEGRVTGVIECFSREVHEPTVDLVEMLDALGNQIGSFIEHKYAEDLLAVRAHQQAVVAEIGQLALSGNDLQALFNDAARLVTQTLGVEYSKILELLPDQERLLLRAGVGWKKGLVGKTYVEVGPRSQGGYSLSISQPIIVTDLNKETRFHPSDILLQHGVVSGLTAIIPGRMRPFGIIGAHSNKRHTFSEDDIHFLQAVAHTLATAVERQEVEEALRLSRHEISVILDGIADGITAQSQTGEIIYANDAAARILGVDSSEELRSMPGAELTSRFEMFDENGASISMDALPGRQVLSGREAAPLTIRFRVKATGEERWSVVKAQPVFSEVGHIMMAVNIFQDVSDLKRTEMAQRLLAEAGNILETSLDYETRLADLARLIVPRMADWCAVDILDENQVLQRVAVVHIDPKKVQWAHELYKRYPPDPNASVGTYNVIRTNQARLVPMVTKEMIDAVPDPKVRKIAEDLHFSSSMTVPLYARGRGLGAITFVWAESGHHYTAADLALAEGLAERAALALDNARLYTDAQRLNTELEERVNLRTAELQTSNAHLEGEIKERERAEQQVRSLNVKLEQRVAERTRQLESANQELQHEIVEREQADTALQLSLQKMRELYETSQNIGLARTPDEVLGVLLSSSYLNSASRASIAIFDEVWKENGDPPGCCVILTGWDRDPQASLEIGREISLMDYGLVGPYAQNEPLRILDVRTDARLPEPVRERLLELGVASSIIFPLIAGGEWYGMLSLHFEQIRTLNSEDSRHLRGLVDEAATAIYNFRLLQAEADARREAEEANKLKMKFLAMISHELRTPLTSIKGFATTLLANDVEWQPAEQRDFVETIDVEADKLADLIEQLLDLSRLEAGTMRIITRRVNWDEILATATVQLQALTANHRLVIEYNPDLPALRVDVARAAQVLTNLVNNAVKYSAPQTPITILAIKLTEMFVKVSVSDQGVGIPPEARNRVFEAFQQLESQRGNTQGAGLGLAICRGLVEAHGGRIWVEDRDGPGTTISFTLPVDMSAPRARM